MSILIHARGFQDSEARPGSHPAFLLAAPWAARLVPPTVSPLHMQSQDFTLLTPPTALLTSHSLSLHPHLCVVISQAPVLLWEMKLHMEGSRLPINYLQSLHYVPGFATSTSHKIDLFITSYFILFYFIYLFRAAPATYGGSQARSRFGAVAASLHHSHSNTRSELCL